MFTGLKPLPLPGYHPSCSTTSSTCTSTRSTGGTGVPGYPGTRYPGYPGYPSSSWKFRVTSPFTFVCQCPVPGLTVTGYPGTCQASLSRVPGYRVPVYRQSPVPGVPGHC
eukprot:2958062-Rhodomonas_salina.1